MQKRPIEGVEVQCGSGNVFADLGLPDAEKLKIKTGLVVEIRITPEQLECCLTVFCETFWICTQHQTARNFAPDQA